MSEDAEPEKRKRKRSPSEPMNPLGEDSTVPASLAETQGNQGDPNTAIGILGRGARLGRYRIRSILGQGGFGAVYLAHDDELDREVAIKVPAKNRFESPEAVDAFIDEARKLAKLKHHGIVAVYDVGRGDDDRPFIVMQYVEGSTLAEFMHAERLGNHRSARLLCDIAEAVAYAHKRGLVHRDLKPSNLLLDSEGGPLVADFGLAVDETEQRRRSGELAGTLPYMAPEQIRGDVHRMDGRTDIWALGVILYQMLTGRLPFGGTSVKQLSDEIQHRHPKPPRQIDEKIAPELERIISKCCAKKVGDRYSTAADMAADLRSYLEPQTTPQPTAQAGSSSHPQPTQSLWQSRGLHYAIAILATCALLVSLLVVPMLLDRGEAKPQGVVHQDSVQRAIENLPALKGTIDVRVWDPDDERRHGLSLHEPAARPLKTDDLVRVEARLSRPAYVYILWVDSAGTVLPLFPWQPGDWGSRPLHESPVSQVSLPAAADEAWPLEGATGIETLLVLVRDSPLPAEVDLKQALSSLPLQSAESPKSLNEFVNGQVVYPHQSTDRGPQLNDPQKIDDSILAAQRIIQEKIGEHFPYTHAVCFANGGERREK